MVGLQALAEYVMLSESQSDDGDVADVSLKAEKLTQTLSLDSSNAMQVQTITVSHALTKPCTQFKQHM